MIYKLNSMDDAETLVEFCKKYKEYGNIDISCGRYTVDGCSYLGVMSQVGNEVKVELISHDENAVTKFNEDFANVFG